MASRIFTQLLLPTDEENAAKTLELADALPDEAFLAKHLDE